MRAGIQLKVSALLVLVLLVAFGVSTALSSQLLARLLHSATSNEAASVFQSLELGTQGSLERGEMEEFQKLIQDLGKVQGVGEIGLAGPSGTVSYSSRPEAKGTPLPSGGFQEAVNARGRLVTLEASGAIEILRSHLYEAPCLECHEKATLGSLAGVLYLRYSLSGLRSAQAKGIYAGVATGLGGLLAASLGVYFLLGTLVRRPLVELAGRLKEMASGEADLTLRLPEASRDEMADVARYFNSFVENLQSLVSDVLATTREVSDGSGMIATVSQAMLHGAQEQNDRTQTAASSAEEMSASVLQVARGAQQAASVATSAAQTAESGSAVVEQGMQGMTRVAERVKDIARTVRELGDRSREIGEVMQVIDDIADQTNLLALNAAIEAARAGEHGRGFAVVADEVRKLSEKTAKATQQVRDTVLAIRQETDKAVESVEAGVAEAGQSVDLSRGAADALREIVAQIERNSDMVNQIAVATEQQSRAVNEISRNLESVAGLARETAAGVEQTSSTAGGLATRTQQLMGLVGRFKV
ncbi:MAG: methyl-accepting chemotaxis protein [Deltaproteobacteria bacterium]|nr:methyl-accepting chemotaxis protein [Deltaproteobacteria bacterium]